MCHPLHSSSLTFSIFQIVERVARIPQSTRQSVFVKIRAEFVGKIELRIRNIPHHKAGRGRLASGSDEIVDRRQIHCHGADFNRSGQNRLGRHARQTNDRTASSISSFPLYARKNSANSRYMISSLPSHRIRIFFETIRGTAPANDRSLNTCAITMYRLILNHPS